MMAHINNIYQTNQIKIMKEFLFLYRTDYNQMQQATPEQMQASLQKWMDWLGSIAAQNKLIDKGHRLQDSGKVIKNDLVTNGPYVDIKESVGGYSFVKAESYDDAVEIAKGCPIHSAGGSVEVRELFLM
jgi:hypothetical protein